MRFYKYHALGNDYIVIEPKDILKLTSKNIQKICHRNYGIGSDGILFGPFQSKKADFKLRIFNPDGSEAEKSGNGIRIFSRHLWERKLTKYSDFRLETKGGIVQVKILDKGKTVKVDMGKIKFEFLEKSVKVKDKTFSLNFVNIGNPHCVIVVPKATPELAHIYGSILETHKLFPNKTNVQFMQVLDRNNIQIEIWERGAGYTLASGSSSSAAASVAKKLGLCDSDITVHMPGGSLKIKVNDSYEVEMTGPVTKVSEGLISFEVISQRT